MMEVDWTSQREPPRQTWCDVRLSQVEAYFRNMWKMKVKGEVANPGLPVAIKMMYVCVKS